jgi:hypothetical protein
LRVRHAQALSAAVRARAEPNGAVGVLVQAAAIGTYLGTLIAYRRRRRDPRFDAFPIVTRWMVAGLLLGVGYVLLAAVR